MKNKKYDNWGGVIEFPKYFNPNKEEFEMWIQQARTSNGDTWTREMQNYALQKAGEYAHSRADYRLVCDFAYKLAECRIGMVKALDDLDHTTEMLALSKKMAKKVNDAERTLRAVQKIMPLRDTYKMNAEVAAIESWNQCSKRDKENYPFERRAADFVSEYSKEADNAMHRHGLFPPTTKYAKILKLE